MTTATRPTQRVIHSCKKCGHTYAFDYQVHTRQTRMGMVVTLMRMTSTEARTETQDGFRCPKCNSLRVQSSAVVGVYTEQHICNGACVSAKGPQCSCSCGGVNHGAGWL